MPLRSPGTAIASTNDVRTDSEIVAAIEASATLDLDAGATIGGSGIVSDADLALVALDDLADVSVASPSDQDVLTWDDGTSTWVAQAAGGSGWPTSTGTDYAGTPYEQALIATTNGDLILSPNGNGALIAQVPDGLGTGGNTRGEYAVDFQRSRVAFFGGPAIAAQVASGDYSFIGSGYANSASGDYSAVITGQKCVASGHYALVSGSQCVAGLLGTAFGNDNEANGLLGSFAIGYTAVASGQTSISLGKRGIATQNVELVHGGGTFGGDYGDAQYSRIVLFKLTTDATPGVLGVDGSPGLPNQRTLAEGDAYTFHVQVVACENATGDTAWWDVRGCIKRPGGIGSTALVGSLTTVTDADAGASTWALAVTADNSGGYLKITATGEASHNIRWVATVQATKVNTVV